ncbi:fumarylacetoacetate hydrolase [Amylocystis lapponica]|nr:fumarylacetoacetate hydrolase [Amylocystis lapponica]
MSPIKTQCGDCPGHIGEPVDPTLDVGLAFHRKEPIKAYEILGSALDPAAQVTTNVLTVKELLAPLDRSQVGGFVRCLGLNYADHAKEAGMKKPDIPVSFSKPATTLIGPGAKVVIPKVAQPIAKHLPDYETELVIVIGKAAKNVSEADALDYVLGYTAANDVSFRWHQLSTTQWGFSKSFDNTNPLGPAIVSASALRDAQSLPLNCILNGKVVQDGNTSNQLFSIRETIAYFSQGTTLPPGSIILTGTPAGVGFVKKPPQFLKHGDVVAVSVGGGIGTLVNEVVEEGALAKAKL